MSAFFLEGGHGDNEGGRGDEVGEVRPIPPLRILSDVIDEVHGLTGVPIEVFAGSGGGGVDVVRSAREALGKGLS